jgi:predicted O-linked N-acetylglucosamine transferase (SPINDLY family)
LDESIALYRKAISLAPTHALAWTNLADALTERGMIQDAITAAKEAIRLQPRLAPAHNNLGIALQRAGLPMDALVSFKNALHNEPAMAEAHNNLGLLLVNHGEIDDAIASFDKAIQVAPNSAAAYNNRGRARLRAGDSAAALADYHAAIRLAPTSTDIQSALIYALLRDPATTPEQLAAELSRFRQQCAAAAPASTRWNNDRSPHRRLKIGYVSADFHTHPVSRFLRPLLDLADPAQVETFCYSNVRAPDATTVRLRAAAHHWRDIRGIPDHLAASMIQNDAIDILVDLSMHTDGNRLPLFARKPAPLQLTYLAYPGTTGLDTVDYRLTDPHIDPPSPSASKNPWLKLCTEKPLHLPYCFWCYDPPAPATAPDITDTPHLASNGSTPLTFGCLNTFFKISQDTLDTWAQLLAELPSAHLLLHVPTGSPRDRTSAFFTSRGIAPERIRYTSLLPFQDYLALHNQIDIALDTFPCAAGTTSCDALFMGVPLITLASPQPWGRGGASILHNVNLPDLIADDRPTYIQLAKHLAQNPSRLRTLRHTMRQTLLSSALTSAPTFARALESLYRQIWQSWCTNRS